MAGRGLSHSHLPGAKAEPLFDTYNGCGGVTEIVNPLARHPVADREPGRYRDDALTPTRRRTGGSRRRRARRQPLGRRRQRSRGRRRRRLARTSPAPNDQVLVIIESLDGPLVPVAPEPVSAAIRSDDGGMSYFADSSVLIKTDNDLDEGRTSSRSARRCPGSPARQAAACHVGHPPADGMFLNLPDDRRRIAQTAQQVTAGTSTNFDRMVVPRTGSARVQVRHRDPDGHDSSAIVQLPARTGSATASSSRDVRGDGPYARDPGPGRRRVHPGRDRRRRRPRVLGRSPRLAGGVVRRLRLGAVRAHAGPRHAWRRGVHRIAAAAGPATGRTHDDHDHKWTLPTRTTNDARRRRHRPPPGQTTTTMPARKPGRYATPPEAAAARPRPPPLPGRFPVAGLHVGRHGRGEPVAVPDRLLRSCTAARWRRDRQSGPITDPWCKRAARALGPGRACRAFGAMGSGSDRPRPRGARCPKRRAGDRRSCFVETEIAQR